MNEFIKEELKQIQGMLRNGYNIDDLTEVDKETVWDAAWRMAVKQERGSS